MGQPESPPQCVVLLASRLPRLAWKYQAIAYRITLMNAGVIFQTLYLVATAMNLACSALGNGNSVSFARATGLDPPPSRSLPWVPCPSPQAVAGRRKKLRAIGKSQMTPAPKQDKTVAAKLGIADHLSAGPRRNEYRALGAFSTSRRVRTGSEFPPGFGPPRARQMIHGKCAIIEARPEG
jgi:hypothetical protein